MALKLIFWKNKILNYGDLLSPYIVRELSGEQIVQKNYFVGNLNSHIYNLWRCLRHGDFRLHDRYLFPFEKNLVGIGSILYTGNSRSMIWGSGFMSDCEKCGGGNVYAVRGKYSLEMLKQQQKDGLHITFHEPVVLGDPALLLPWLIPASTDKLHKVGIIPHFSEYDYFSEQYGDRYHIINLQSDDIEGVTNEITSCQYVLSSSLHGIIVAHAYGIPALWIEHTGLESYTKGFKFRDYFSVVGIDNYEPLKDLEQILASADCISEKFSNMAHNALPTVDLDNLRRELLRVAPFHVFEKYKKL